MKKLNIDYELLSLIPYILIAIIIITILITKTSECKSKGGKYIGSYCVREEYLIDDKD